MAWTAPRTHVTGEITTASILNTHLRDDMLETAPAKAAAAGDIFYATAANAIAPLTLGTKGRHLVVNDGQTAPIYVPGIDIEDRDLTQVPVVDNADRTTVYSHEIGAGSLGATGGVRLTISGTYFNNSGGTRTLTYRGKLGTTDVIETAITDIVVDANWRRWRAVIEILNSAADAQKWSGQFQLTHPSSAVHPIDDLDSGDSKGGILFGTSTEDTSAARTLDISFEHSTDHVSLEVRAEVAFLERIAA